MNFQCVIFWEYLHAFRALVGWGGLGSIAFHGMDLKTVEIRKSATASRANPVFLLSRSSSLLLWFTTHLTPARDLLSTLHMTFGISRDFRRLHAPPSKHYRQHRIKPSSRLLGCLWFWDVATVSSLHLGHRRIAESVYLVLIVLVFLLKLLDLFTQVEYFLVLFLSGFTLDLEVYSVNLKLKMQNNSHRDNYAKCLLVCREECAWQAQKSEG